MSPYATIALLALVLSVAAQDNVHKTTVNANVNWNKQDNAAVGNVNVNGKNTPFTVSISGNSNNNQPTFTIQSQNPAGKTTTVKIIPIKPITSALPPRTQPGEPPKPVHQDVPIPVPSAAPVPFPKPEPATLPVPVQFTSNKPVVTSVSTSSFTSSSSSTTVRTSTFTAQSSDPNKPTVTVRSQTVSSSAEPSKPVTVTVVSMTKPATEPRSEPVTITFPVPPHPTPAPIPTNAPVPTNVATAVGKPEPYFVNCEIRENRHHPECRDRHHEGKRKGCHRRLWIKGIILGLAAFGALALIALCCRLCRGGRCCRRCHRECERNPTYGIPAPVPMNNMMGQPQVFVVQAQPVDPYFQPSLNNTNRSGQPFVQLNETNPDTSANYVIGYPQPHEQPIYMVPPRN